MSFHQRLRELRLNKNLNQGHVAKALGYGYSAISNYESGRNEPSIKDLILLAKFFNVSVDYLIGATDIQRNFEDDSPLKKELKWFLDMYFKLPKKAQEDLQSIILQIMNFYYHD